MKKFKIGIIGLGHVSDYYFEALKELNWRFDLVAICDKDPIKRKKAPENIPFFDDYNIMLSQTNLDVVIIATPNASHYKIAKEIIPRLSTIIIEKPVTLRKEKFLELNDFAKENDCNLITAFHASFGKDVIWFKDNYSHQLKNELGRIVGFNCEFFDPYNQNGLIEDSKKKLTGSWVDSGINALSVIHSVLDIKNIIIDKSYYSSTSIDKDFNTFAIIHYRFQENNSNFFGNGIIHTNWNLNKNYKSTSLFFENSGFKINLNHSEQKVTLIRPNNIVEVLADFSNTGERLVNHYVGVFSNILNLLDNNSSNKTFSFEVHKTFYITK